MAGGLAAAATIATRVDSRNKAYPWPLGLQLWSVAAELGKDLPGTFARLAALGYTRAETAGWYDLTPAAFAKAAASAGLTCDSAHVGMGELIKDIPAAVGQARDAGCRWLVCASPQPSRPLRAGVDWNVAMAEAMTPEDWHRNAEVAARTGAAAKATGIGFAWHNHVAEFVADNGKRGIDILLAETDAAHVSLELDIAWASVGGEDPSRFIAAHADRVRLIHVKDVMRRADNTLGPAVVGSGSIDWRIVFAAARKVGVRHAFVEIEPPHPRPVFDELAAARDFIGAL